MKKVVVVIGSQSCTFEGKELQVDNNESNLLIVRDMAREYEGRDIAVFKNWNYWREVEVVGSTKKKTELTYGDTDKLTIINKKGWCVASLFVLPDGNLAEDSWIRHKTAAEKLAKEHEEFQKNHLKPKEEEPTPQ